MSLHSFLRVSGVVFILIAIWGFLDGERVLIFHVNTAHNVVHLLSGLGLFAAGFADLPVARVVSLVFGIVYALVAVLGFAGVRAVVDLLHLNPADNWLHLILALPFIALSLKPSPRVARA
ncbi:hypothetical protein PHYC_00585 [Phycisphaerales bacterium]|nr:hypothetical protein PHYC_00585 [Phycisphaerales bacterium]